MSSRSNGVTKVRLRRSTTSRVSRSPSCSSSFTSRKWDPCAGNSSSRSTSWREMPIAFADARSRSLKNSRFCGTSEIRATALLSVDRGSLSGVAVGRVRRVRELSELGREQVGGLLPDIDRVVPDPLQRPRDDHHPEPVLAHVRVTAQFHDSFDDPPVCPVDELVEVDQGLSAL